MSKKPASKTFTSPQGWFYLTLPQDWDEYDDNDETTCAFFNTKSWTGNLRITAFRWTDPVDPNDDKAARMIEEEMTEKKEAIKIKLGNFECAHYKNESMQDGGSLMIYYWMLGEKSNLFLCTFAIDKDMEHTRKNLRELKVVQNIIGSIKIN